MSISFNSAKNFASGINANQIATGDFNGDGQLDLVIDSSTRKQMQLSILLGTKNGGFSKAKTFATEQKGTAKSIVTGDFNRDGNFDVAVVNPSDSVMVLLGDGGGRLHSPSRFLAGTAAAAMAGGDFNGDGQQDLVVATDGGRYSPPSWGVTVLLNDGTGQFTPAPKLGEMQSPVA